MMMSAPRERSDRPSSAAAGGRFAVCVLMPWPPRPPPDRKSTRLNSSHTEIYTLPLHDALPIYDDVRPEGAVRPAVVRRGRRAVRRVCAHALASSPAPRSEEHTSELQSHRDLHSSPTRRSSDL